MFPKDLLFQVETRATCDFRSQNWSKSRPMSPSSVKRWSLLDNASRCNGMWSFIFYFTDIFRFGNALTTEEEEFLVKHIQFCSHFEKMTVMKWKSLTCCWSSCQWYQLINYLFVWNRLHVVSAAYPQRAGDLRAVWLMWFCTGNALHRLADYKYYVRSYVPSGYESEIQRERLLMSYTEKKLISLHFEPLKKTSLSKST